MKSVLLLFLFIYSQSYAQKGKKQTTAFPGNSFIVTSAQTFGYVGGIRLDSVNAEYAEFRWRAFNEGLSFDYGQSWKMDKELAVRDKEGHLLLFGYYSTALILNFFFFNGWELNRVYGVAGTGANVFILKRK